jgi:competence protein ComEC
MGAEYFDRSYDRLSALALSALIIFIRHPLLVFQAGVQFSFVAVLSVGVLWPALEPLLKIKNRKISWLISQLGPSSAVTIGTVPLMAYYYGSVPLTGTLLNLIVLPLAGCIVPVGMTMGIVGLCCMPAASFLGGSLRSLLWLINHLCLMLASIPGNNLRTGSPPFMLLVLYYLAVLLTLLILNISEYRCRKAALLLGVCLMILIPFRRWEAMVVFLDVGQGDCIFIRDSKGTTWLIDGGSSDVKNVGKYRMLPLLDYYGEEKIDYVCVTHGDEDHVSGIRELIDASRAECLVLTSASMEDDTCMALAESAGQKMIKTIYINAGDQWNSRGWQMTCIAPDEGMSLNNKNDQSMILRLETGAMNFLFTGDISSDAEKRLDSELLMDIDVLKVAHHGSGSSSSEAFLETAGAGIAVISCGKNNRYGHPASDTMARLEAAGRQVYLTMDEGAIIMKYRNGRFVLDTDNDSCHD